MYNVILAGGTSDSRDLAEKIAGKNIMVYVTVATEYAGSLVKSNEYINVLQGRLDAEEIKQLIKRSKAVCLVDSSHPYADVLSLNCIKACKEAGILYIRYERENLREETVGHDSIIYASDAIDAAKKLNNTTGNILFLTGSKTLDIYAELIENFNKRSFVRILPLIGVVNKCFGLGLDAGHIIAMKGPFDLNMNYQTIKHVNASCIVTKMSGKAGGETEKIQAAKKAGIKALVVKRPVVPYPLMTHEIKKVIEFVNECIKGVKK